MLCDLADFLIHLGVLRAEPSSVAPAQSCAELGCQAPATARAPPPTGGGSRAALPRHSLWDSEEGRSLGKLARRTGELFSVSSRGAKSVTDQHLYKVRKATGDTRTHSEREALKPAHPQCQVLCSEQWTPLGAPESWLRPLRRLPSRVTGLGRRHLESSASSIPLCVVTLGVHHPVSEEPAAGAPWVGGLLGRHLDLLSAPAGSPHSRAAPASDRAEWGRFCLMGGSSHSSVCVGTPSLTKTVQ